MYTTPIMNPNNNGVPTYMWKRCTIPIMNPNNNVSTHISYLFIIFPSPDDQWTDDRLNNLMHEETPQWESFSFFTMHLEAYCSTYRDIEKN